MSTTGITGNVFLTTELFGFEDLLAGPETELNTRAAAGLAFDFGIGLPGLLGADIEVAHSSEARGINGTIQIAGGGYSGQLSATAGEAVSSLQVTGGKGFVAGTVLNADSITGVRLGLVIDHENGQLRVERQLVSESSVGFGIVSAGVSAEAGPREQWILMSWDPDPVTSYPDYTEQRLQDLAHGRGVESPVYNYLEAQAKDDSSGMAHATMQLPGVYKDAVLREAAGYGVASQAEIDRVSREQRQRDLAEETAQLEAEMRDTAGEHEAPNANDPDDIDKSGPKPIILDLDGNGISVTELAQSTHFVDGGDGLKHRTAWASAGDGVLFYDVSGDAEITEKREYVFTDWDPCATSDLEALRSVFDTSGDGKLTSADSTFASFKVMVTKPDGTTEAKTLAQLGITEIDLNRESARRRQFNDLIAPRATTKCLESCKFGKETVLGPASIAFRIPSWGVAM